MTYSKSSMRAVDKYVKNNYDSFLVRVPKGRKQTIEALCRERNESVNAMVNRLIRAELGLSEEKWKQKEEIL